VKKRCIVFQGVLQKRFYDLAKRAGKSAKRRMPDVDVVFLTDLDLPESRWVDRIVKVPPAKMADAHLARLWHLPEFDSGIYMGPDARFCKPLYDVFELVEDGRTDVALTAAPGKLRERIYPPCGVPSAFPHFRGAFLAFQDNARVRQFFELYRTMFHEHRKKYMGKLGGKPEGPCFPDQMVMRTALYHSDVSIAMLPQNYCCTCGDVILRGTVKTVTGGRGIDVSRLVKEANRLSPELRLFKDGKSRLI